MRILALLFFIALVFMPVLGPLSYAIIIGDYLTMKRGKQTKDILMVSIFIMLFILQVIMFSQF